MIGRSTALICALLPALGSCNSYELFRVSGYEQQSFNNKADVLFVIDNSDSMLEESASLATNFAAFIAEIDTVEQERSYVGLSDAVTNYVDYVQNRSAFVDYRFSITTTDVNTDAGKLVGRTVKRGEANVPERFIDDLVCEATCFSSASVLPTDPGYQCGDPLGDTLSEEYVQCACGASYIGNCGSAVEEGLEAVFLAMCRAVPNPPVECFADVEIEDSNGNLQVYPALVDPSDTLSNPEMLRDDA
ncbi:MAG: VWA domain-containing protein, partial [Myxococcales bacterium]|nr:VWA domain-containing protein [Myxococcales bacterium]